MRQEAASPSPERVGVVVLPRVEESHGRHAGALEGEETKDRCPRECNSSRRKGVWGLLVGRPPLRKPHTQTGQLSLVQMRHCVSRLCCASAGYFLEIFVWVSGFSLPLSTVQGGLVFSMSGPTAPLNKTVVTRPKPQRTCLRPGLSNHGTHSFTTLKSPQRLDKEEIDSPLSSLYIVCNLHSQREAPRTCTLGRRSPGTPVCWVATGSETGPASW